MYPEKNRQQMGHLPETICPGGSVIISPMGQILEGPLYDQAGALVAELDLDMIIQSKLDFDVIGHYARNDIFHYSVSGQPDIVVE